jgi:molybdenum cofactor cytidylyltransferase
MANEQIAAVVLAAGLSSRMGENKLLIELQGKSVVRHAVEMARTAGLSPILVVVGHQRERIAAALDGDECVQVLNPQYASGMHTSLCAGIACVPSGCKAAVVMLADMPLVGAPMLRELVSTFQTTAAPLVVSTYEGVLAPPVLYSRALFSELLLDDSEGNGRRLIQRHRSRARELAWPATALLDLDRPEDVERVRALFEQR